MKGGERLQHDHAPLSREPAQRSVITLRSSTWALVLGVVVLLLFILFAIVSPEPLQEWYYRTQVAPALHEDLGFIARKERTTACCPDTRLAIVSVVPGGVFDRAGIEAGDLPWDTHGREAITFYRRLENARGKAADLTLVRPGGAAGRGAEPRRMNFRIPVPARDAVGLHTSD